MTIQIRDSSSWKTVSFPYVRGEHYNGTSGQVWLPIHLIHVYDGNTGLWKEAFRNTDGNYPQVSQFTYYNTTSYTVEQGVRFIKFRLTGASGGGAGGTKLYWNNSTPNYTGTSYTNNLYRENYTGGTGGPSQRFDTLIEVIPGEVYTMSPGSAGNGGNAHDARACYAYSGGPFYQNVSFSGGGTSSNPYTASVGGSNGGSGGNTTVTGSARSVNLRAYGGTGGIAASGSVSYYYQYYQDNDGDPNYAIIGSKSLVSVANGTGNTHLHHLIGTQANGAAITKTNEVTITGGTGGSGGTNALQSGAPSNGGNGSGGAVEMTLYKKAP